MTAEEKTKTRIDVDMQYFWNMIVRRLHRLRQIGRVRPLGGLPWTFVFTLLFLSASAVAGPLIPTNPGTTWRYNMTEELGKGLSISNLKPNPYGKVRLPVIYRLEGTEDVDGKGLLKFEMHRAGSI